MSEAQQAIAELFRHESGRILASLIRACGDFELAEDGVPPNPGTWLTTTGASDDRPVKQRTA